MQGLCAHTLTDWHGPECSPRDVSLPPSMQRGFLLSVCRDQFPLTNFTGLPIWSSRSKQWDLPHKPRSCSGNATLTRKFQVPCIIKIYFNKLHSSWQPACWSSQRAENQHQMPQQKRMTFRPVVQQPSLHEQGEHWDGHTSIYHCPASFTDVG